MGKYFALVIMIAFILISVSTAMAEEISFTDLTNSETDSYSNAPLQNKISMIPIAQAASTVKIMTSLDSGMPIIDSAGKTVRLNTTLKSADNKPISDKTVEFFVNGVSIGSAQTARNGKASLSYTLKPEDTYYSAEFTEDDAYLGSKTIQIPMTIKTATTLVAGGPITSNIGKDVELEATLTDSEDKPISGKRVEFLINGVSIGSAVTNSDGKAQISYTLKVGDAYYSAKYDGDATYFKSETVKTKIDSKTETNISMGGTITGSIGTVHDLNATLTDAEGNILSGKNIEFFVNGVSIGNDSTNSEGQASFSYTLKADDTHYSARFAEDELYYGSAKQEKIIIKTLTNLVAGKTSSNNNKVIKLNSKLTDPANKPVSGKMIRFYVNDGFVGTAQTDDDGRASYSYTLKDEDAYYSAEFEEDSEYYGSLASKRNINAADDAEIGINPIIERLQTINISRIYGDSKMSYVQSVPGDEKLQFGSILKNMRLVLLALLFVSIVVLCYLKFTKRYNNQ